MQPPLTPNQRGDFLLWCIYQNLEFEALAAHSRGGLASSICVLRSHISAGAIALHPPLLFAKIPPLIAYKRGFFYVVHLSES
jgi:hypothetical protein